jgi:SAM-dependent methyltransferase
MDLRLTSNRQNERSLRFEPWAIPALPGEADEALRTRREAAFYKWQTEVSNREFWSRLGPLEVANKRVLELGCGHGALAIDIARRGAAAVLGIDLDTERIAFAEQNLADEHPAYRNVVRFACVDLADITAEFDIIISKDSFEHIEDLSSMTREMARLLVPHGLIAVGFGPLYYSPFGDHGRFLGRRLLPWLPILVPERLLLRLARRRTDQKINSVADLGLNKLEPEGFRDIFAEPTWRLLRVEYNRGGKPLMGIMRALRRLRPLEKLFTVNIYAILRKEQGN